MNLGGGGGDTSFTYKFAITCLVILFLMPVFVSVFIPQSINEMDNQEQSDILFNDYKRWTGQDVPNTTTVWALTGIYTPYNSTSASYLWTDDGWLSGIRYSAYSPDQYSTGNGSYSVTYKNGFYYYDNDVELDSHKAGDLYTSISMDRTEKSNVFFTTNNREQNENGFWYEYTGLRYAFQPLSNNPIIDQEGNQIPVVNTTTSLSLIWYSYYEQSDVGGSGIAGQLIVSGSDGGLAYLTSQNIISAFNSTTNIASFPMTFNGGIPITLNVKIDPQKTAIGYSVKECYDNGWWSVMVTSQTVDATAYVGTDYSFNIYNIWEVAVNLMTFNMDSYGSFGDTGTIMSWVMTIIFYAGLIAIGLNHYPVLILAGILAIFQTISSVITNWGGLF